MSATLAPDTPRQRSREDERHLRVAPPPGRRHTLRYALAALVVAGAAVFGAVSLNAMAAGEAVRAEELQQRVVEARRAHDQLVAEVARLEAPDRIRHAARELGMVPAPTRHYLTSARPLPSDGAPGRAVRAGETTDPLKPVLSAQE